MTASPRLRDDAPPPADWAWLPAATAAEWEHCLGTGRAHPGSAPSASSAAAAAFAAGSLSLAAGGADLGDGGGDDDDGPWPLRLRIVAEWRGFGALSASPPAVPARGSGPLRCVLASPGESFAVAAAGGSLRVFDLASLGCVAEYAQHRGAPTAAALLPARLQPAGGASSATPRLSRRGDALDTDAFDAPFDGNAELDAAVVLSADAAGGIHAWRAATGEHLGSMQEPGAMSSAVPAAASSAAVGASPGIGGGAANGGAASPAASAGGTAVGGGSSSPGGGNGGEESPCGIACLRALDGGWSGRAVAGLRDGRLRFLDASTGRLLHAWRAAPASAADTGAAGAAVRALALTAPDGRGVVAAGLGSGAVSLLDARAGSVVRCFLLSRAVE